MRVGDVWIRSD